MNFNFDSLMDTISNLRERARNTLTLPWTKRKTPPVSPSSPFR